MIKRESPHRRAEWRWITICEVSKGKFSLRFPVTYIPVTALDLKSVGENFKTENLKLADALKAGDMIEEWRETQEGDKKARKRNVSDAVATASPVVLELQKKSKKTPRLPPRRT